MATAKPTVAKTNTILVDVVLFVLFVYVAVGVGGPGRFRPKKVPCDGSYGQPPGSALQSDCRGVFFAAPAVLSPRSGLHEAPEAHPRLQGR